MSNNSTETMSESDKVKAGKRSKAYEKFGYFETQTRFLEGKMLTIVDASYSDREQREAVKSLVRKEIREWSTWVMKLIINTETNNESFLPDGTPTLDR